MPPRANHQTELKFEDAASPGWDRWKEERHLTLKEVARNLGMPLGFQVEVWLKGEIRLRGILRLQEQLLMPEAFDPSKLMLEVDRVPFIIGEMVSCVRTEG